MARYTRSLRLAALFSVGLLGACNTEPTQPEPEPGTEVTPKLPAEEQAELDQLMKQINDSANMTAADFADKYAISYAGNLPYNPKEAEFLDVIQASSLGLDTDEMEKLGTNGFIISDKKKFPTFGYGYAAIYSQDLPLYVSADSILFAVHRSYDKMLQAVEQSSLIPELSKLLLAMRDKLSKGGAGSLGTQAQADADLFLAVAKSLLDDQLVAPVAGGSASDIEALVEGANQASGEKEITLFGAARIVDFSQFEPRGHYTDTEELKRYFRAMMWLGRIDFRFLEPDQAGKLMFHRRQLEGAFALGELMDDTSTGKWTQIDNTIHAFAGKADYMVVPQLDDLAKDLGVTDPGEIANIADGEVAQAILDGKYGTQLISSHIMINGLGKGTLPLSSSFAFFGQRYVVDSHVFSNVVYDRVQGGSQKRMMPDPLDAAFAALKNDQAGQMLVPQLTEWNYAPDLHAMRLLVDAHPQEFWQDNLYNLWLNSLRTLGPSGDMSDPASKGMPFITGTEKWGRRVLNTQLASWAELRHDTILYAKQSYTGGATCEFPDAYVEPYPEFFDKLTEFADHGKVLAEQIDFGNNTWLHDRFNSYFDNLHNVSKTLASMAEHERTGTPFDTDQMAFINQTVKLQEGCGDPAGLDGWYAQLFFDNENSVMFDPTIADVHTQPTDEFGNMVGRVLHVGTGHARLLVVTADTCVGPRAYVGLASSYFEKITENFERMTDEEWAAELNTKAPQDVPWMTDLVSK
ncbi:MAG: DUF3160 domain-containing protein [Polyangiaceae bacterium]|nr:DUF3160 domain-containing protein [Polyangiaceae bacterium]